MDSFLYDLRHAVRGLRRSPGFTLLAVGALALGIGASSSIFCVLDGILFRPLPLPQPERLYAIHEVRPDGADNWWSPANYLDLARESRTFSSVAAFYPFEWNVSIGGEPERAEVAAVSASLFPTLGIQPALGRIFAPEEDADVGERVALVSSGFWRRALKADPAALNRFVAMSERQVRVVGVLPPGFRIPGGPDADVYVPLRLDEEDRKNRGSHYFRVVGRLAGGETLDRAQAELRLIATRIVESDPRQHAGWSARAVGLREQVVGPVSRPLQLLLAAVLLLVLIACTNVAGLLLARGAVRQREFAIRAAVGGGRARIVRQLLTEALLLAALGGACGLLLAAWSVDALIALAPRSLPRLDEVHLDLRVAGFAALLAALSTALAGLWPALHSSRTDLAEALKDFGLQSAGPRRSRARRALVVGEIALALILVIGAALMIRSFRRVLDEELGFQPERLLKAELGVPFARWKTGKPYSDFYLAVEERMARLPGVESAALTTLLPLEPGGAFDNDIHVEGHPEEPHGQARSAQITWVTPRYFHTLQIPLVRGRGFEAGDGWRTPPVVVVNQAFVRRYLVGEEPVGARLRIFNGRFGDEADTWTWTIVGVAHDAREWGLDRQPLPEIFIDVAQQPSTNMTLAVRTIGVPSAVPLAIERAVREEMLRIDSAIPLARMGTLEQALAVSLTPRRFQMLLLSLFGAAALLLSALGIYGLLAFSVNQRMREFGIRVALGATKGAVLSLVLGEALRLAAAGIALGALASLGATRLLEGSLYGVLPTDPATWAAVAALIGAVALASSVLPARRATRVDPAIALRAE